MVKALDNPFAAALAAEAPEHGLKYVNDQTPGLRRKARGKTLIYFDANGSQITDHNTLVRIKRLAIPPAWTEVWICPDEDGHIQATGRDARGRKQYRYHARWRVQRDENKFAHMIAFARALPRIRRRVQSDLRLKGLPRVKTLATVVRLLEATLIRVGNDEYARTNKSYGLTTMHDRHVRIRGGQIQFSFRGKSGVNHEINVHDPYLAKVVKRCQEIPGQELFAYRDEGGRPRDVTSQDVNAYLREAAGEDFTAKDFRTWAGTVLAAIALREFEEVTSQKQAKKNVITAVEAVAKTLGNTPAVCRKCYIHPAILDSYLTGTTIATLAQRADRVTKQASRGLTREETTVLALLKRRLQQAAEKPAGLSPETTVKPSKPSRERTSGTRKPGHAKRRGDS